MTATFSGNCAKPTVAVIDLTLDDEVSNTPKRNSVPKPAPIDVYATNDMLQSNAGHQFINSVQLASYPSTSTIARGVEDDPDITFVGQVETPKCSPDQLNMWHAHLTKAADSAYDVLFAAEGNECTYKTAAYANKAAVEVLLRAGRALGATVFATSSSVGISSLLHKEATSVQSGPLTSQHVSQQITVPDVAEDQFVLMRLKTGEMVGVSRPALQRIVDRAIHEEFTGRIYKLKQSISLDDEPTVRNHKRLYSHHALSRKRRAMLNRMHEDNQVAQALRGRNAPGDHWGDPQRQRGRYFSAPLSGGIHRSRKSRQRHGSNLHYLNAQSKRSAPGQHAGPAGHHAGGRSMIMPHQAFSGAGAQKSTPLTSETNRGFAMLERMGWRQGGGLGTDGNGRVDPVEARTRSYRTGIGH